MRWVSPFAFAAVVAFAAIGCTYDLDHFQPADAAVDAKPDSVSPDTSLDTSTVDVGSDADAAGDTGADVVVDTAPPFDAATCSGKPPVDCWRCCGAAYPKAANAVEVSSKLHECACRDTVCATACNKQICKGSTTPLGDGCVTCVVPNLTTTCADDLAIARTSEPTLDAFVACVAVCK